MTEIIPNFIDNAVVFSVNNICRNHTEHCEDCINVVFLFHNLIKKVNIEYLIFDFQEERAMCHSFLEELIHLRKRITVPFLFAGVLEGPEKYLESYDCSNTFPMFVTPEDAVRALRMQHPGVTEIPLENSLDFDKPIDLDYKSSWNTSFKSSWQAI